MRAKVAVSWVVYRMTLHKNPDGIIAVCEQSEWDEMELNRPGYHRLIRGGILIEGEAEKLAREEAGGPPAKVRLHAR